jgi:hypothetical protein
MKDDENEFGQLLRKKTQKNEDQRNVGQVGKKILSHEEIHEYKQRCESRPEQRSRNRCADLP